MKLAQDYARALWRHLEKGAAPASAAKSLHALMKSRGHISLAPKVARAFRTLTDSVREKKTMRLYVGNSADSKAALRECGVVEQEVETRVDDTLIGGWKLVGRGRIVDASYKRQLLAMYQRITNSH